MLNISESEQILLIELNNDQILKKNKQNLLKLKYNLSRTISVDAIYY